jgi:hypothetical protein
MKSRALIGFEVLIVVTMKKVVFWVVTQNYMDTILIFRALIFHSDNYVENVSHNPLISLRDNSMTLQSYLNAHKC